MHNFEKFTFPKHGLRVIFPMEFGCCYPFSHAFKQLIRRFMNCSCYIPLQITAFEDTNGVGGKVGYNMGLVVHDIICYEGKDAIIVGRKNDICYFFCMTVLIEYEDGIRLFYSMQNKASGI